MSLSFIVTARICKGSLARFGAQIGKIPGAFKVGNRWLLEQSVLQAMGMMRDVVNRNLDGMRVDNQSGGEDAEQQISVIDGQQQQNGI